MEKNSNDIEILEVNDAPVERSVEIVRYERCVSFSDEIKILRVVRGPNKVQNVGLDLAENSTNDDLRIVQVDGPLHKCDDTKLVVDGGISE